MSGNWYFALRYASPYTALNNSNPWFLRLPPAYSAQVRWSHKAWTLAFLAQNVFSRFAETTNEMDYGISQQYYRQYSEEKGRNLHLTITYSLGYGKKHERGDTGIEKTIDNAIMTK